MRLEQVGRETMLRAAHRHAAYSRKLGSPLWGFVMDICCVGSTSAHAICRELGWDPDALAVSALPARKP